MDFSKPIKTFEQAKQFIADLIDAGQNFHFEDDPTEVVRSIDGERIFTDEEAVHLRERVAELYSFEWLETGNACPIGYALDLTDPDWKEKYND